MALAGTMGMSYDWMAGDVVAGDAHGFRYDRCWWMASSIASSGHDIAQIAQAWIVDGLLCGLGALVAVKVDESVN